ncbi:hypothetical protein ACFRFQ_17810 [Rhodococcus sp. NPDC056743]|uniref:hypothetical protein n=1 Tax=Rhodococcus sp. NPDC056743 TaxID=3345934 RepID=UPI00366BC499
MSKRVYIGIALVAFVAGWIVLTSGADMGAHPTLSKRDDALVVCGSALNPDTDSPKFADNSVYYTENTPERTLPRGREYAIGCEDQLAPRKWIGWILVVGGAVVAGGIAATHVRSRPDEIRIV